MTQNVSFTDNPLAMTRTIVLFLAAVSTGLSAGFFFAWQFASIPGLRLLDDVDYIQTMNAMNSTIRNAGFGSVFFGSMVLMAFALALRARQWRTKGFLLLCAALTLYVFGLTLITATVHVPMNIELLSHTDLTEIDVAVVRASFENRWNTWHAVRTCAAVGSFAMLMGSIFTERLSRGRD